MAESVGKLSQTGHPHDQPDLETLGDNLVIFAGNESEQIVDAYEAGLNSLSPSSPSVTVEEAARMLFLQIQIILPLTADKGKQAFRLENLATLFMRTAQQTPSRHIGQELLLTTIKLMHVSPEETWREGFQAALRMRMRDGWSGEFFLTQPRLFHHSRTRVSSADIYYPYRVHNGKRRRRGRCPDSRRVA